MKKKVTIYDIASMLDVSTATVTRALNGQRKVGKEKRELIQKTAREMGYQANKVAVSLARKQIRICVLIYGSVDVFYNELINGSESAYQELQDFNVVRDIYVFSTKQFADQEFVQEMSKIAKKKYDGLMFYSVNDTPEIAKVVDQLIEKGVVVYTLNTDISTRYNHYCIMNNGFVSGMLAAELLDWMVYNRKVCYFKGGEHTQILKNISKAFTNEAMRRNLVLLDSYYDDGDETKACDAVDHIFLNHPDVEGIYINSAFSEPICNRIVEKNLHRKIKIVTSDLLPSIHENIDKGIVQATIFQDPFMQAKRCFENLYKIIAEGYRPERNIYTTPQIITRSILQNTFKADSD
jgi:LacI family transcriptional regulator